MRSGRYWEILSVGVALSMPAWGALIFQGAVTSPSGDPAVLTISPTTTNDRGCVSVVNATSDAFGSASCDLAMAGTGGTDETGANNASAFLNSTGSFQNIGAARASELRVVFNPNEGAGGGSSTLEALILKIYDSAGTLLFSTALASSMALSYTDATTGFAFRIDDATVQTDVNLANAFSVGSWQTNRVALQAFTTNITGAASQEYFLRTNTELGLNETPEPVTSWVVITCLVGLWAYGRPKNKQHLR